jgi:hypothetical protein
MLSVDRFKNEGPGLTLSIVCLKKQIRDRHCRLIAQFFDDRCPALLTLNSFGAPTFKTNIIQFKWLVYVQYRVHEWWLNPVCCSMMT